MAIFTNGIACLNIEHVIIAEGARRAQSFASSHTLTGSAANAARKAFWVLYALEKFASFYFGRSSVFVDTDICTPLPSCPEAMFGDLDWFLTMSRHARLLSKTLTALFSVGVTGNPRSYYLGVIDQLAADLEQWRLSIPIGMRAAAPSDGGQQQSQGHAIAALREPSMRAVAVTLHYLYSSFLLVLSRTTLHLAANSTNLIPPARASQCKQTIMHTSRTVLELTVFIDVEPHTPLWLLAGIPVMSLFVLFDLVINNPRHPETGSNLALLDVAGGHFSRMEYASGGSLPGSLIAEFAHVAREYVNEVRRGMAETAPDSASDHVGSQAQPPQSNMDGAPQYNADSATVQVGKVMNVLPLADLPQNDQEMPLTDTQALGIFGGDLFGGRGAMDDGSFLGTDVMDLFSSFIPGIDPMFYQGGMDDGGFYGTGMGSRLG
jgi:hypothetical protein